MKQIKKTVHRESRNEAGVSMVEMAVVIPLFVLLVFGSVQAAMVFQTYVSLRDVAAEGARYAAFTNPSPSNASVTDRVSNLLDQRGLESTRVTSITINTAHASAPGMQKTRVDLTYNMPLVFPSFLTGSGGVFQLAVDAEFLSRVV